MIFMHKLILILLTAVAVFAADKQPRNDYWKESDVEILFDGNIYGLRSPDGWLIDREAPTLLLIKAQRADFVKWRNAQLDAENEVSGFWKDNNGKWWQIVEKKPDENSGAFIGFTGGITMGTITTYSTSYCSNASCKTCNP
jgi:hypothetical protein